jgi:hypothetical protein
VVNEKGIVFSDEFTDERDDSDVEVEDESHAVILPVAPHRDGEQWGVDHGAGVLKVCKIVQLEDGRSTRTPFMTAQFRISENSWLHLWFADGQREEISLFGGRALEVRISATNPGAGPRGVPANSVLFHPAPAAGVSWVFACASVDARDRLADSFCYAGCIMRDLANQVRLFSDMPSEMPDFIRIVEPKTTRTRTRDQFAALKVACDAEKAKQLLNELKFMRTLEHDAILRVHGMYELKLNGTLGLGLLIDFKTGRDLSKMIPAFGMGETRAKCVLTQLCSALEYLNVRRVVHRDIKPSNVFCETAADGSLRAILADFGLAARVDDLKKMSTRCGSAGYIAPEIFRRDWGERCSDLEYDEEYPDSNTEYEERIADLLKIDVFSLGMVLYAMATGTNDLITDDLRESYRNNARGELSQRAVEKLSDKLQDLTYRLCKPDPRKRFSISDASSHPWLN